MMNLNVRRRGSRRAQTAEITQFRGKKLLLRGSARFRWILATFGVINCGAWTETGTIDEARESAEDDLRGRMLRKVPAFEPLVKTQNDSSSPRARTVNTNPVSYTHLRA